MCIQLCIGYNNIWLQRIIYCIASSMDLDTDAEHAPSDGLGDMGWVPEQAEGKPACPVSTLIHRPCT